MLSCNLYKKILLHLCEMMLMSGETKVVCVGESVHINLLSDNIL